MTDNPFDNLIGLHCIECRCGYAGHLIIELSSYPDKLSLLTKNLEKAEWRFETVSAAWRLTSDQKFQTGGSETEEHNDTKLKLILGSKVVKVQHNNKTDISIFFDNGFQIDTFLQGEKFPPFELHLCIQGAHDPKILEMTIHGEWQEPEDIGFTDEDELANNHSENTQKRWEEIVPARSIHNPCRNCAYYLQTSGRFYFWDFGICSNGKSAFDGKVVGVNSSCEYFCFELCQIPLNPLH